MSEEKNESTGIGILFGLALLAMAIFALSLNLETDFQYCDSRPEKFKKQCFERLMKYKN